MKTPNRDLLVLVKDEFASEKFMEQELEQLNEMLFHFETMDNFCSAHELFDINRLKISRNNQYLRQIARIQKLRPFQFLCNRN
jgi:hypothetical protein